MALVAYGWPQRKRSIGRRRRRRRGGGGEGRKEGRERGENEESEGA